MPTYAAVLVLRPSVRSDASTADAMPVLLPHSGRGRRQPFVARGCASVRSSRALRAILEGLGAALTLSKSVTTGRGFLVSPGPSVRVQFKRRNPDRG